MFTQSFYSHMYMCTYVHMYVHTFIMYSTMDGLYGTCCNNPNALLAPKYVATSISFQGPMENSHSEQTDGTADDSTTSLLRCTMSMHELTTACVGTYVC